MRYKKMKKCSICNSENVRNYPFELGFITSHIPNENGVLPVNPKFSICMDCGHVFITDMAQFGSINAGYSEFFSEPYPARSCVQVAALPKGVSIEIEAIAIK